jgi:hypothetical protein
MATLEKSVKVGFYNIGELKLIDKLQSIAIYFEEQQLQILFVHLHEPPPDINTMCTSIQQHFASPISILIASPTAHGHVTIAIYCSKIKTRQICIPRSEQCIKIGVLSNQQWTWILSTPSEFATNPDYQSLLTQTSDKLWNNCLEWQWNYCTASSNSCKKPTSQATLAARQQLPNHHIATQTKPRRFDTTFNLYKLPAVTTFPQTCELLDKASRSPDDLIIGKALHADITIGYYNVRGPLSTNKLDYICWLFTRKKIHLLHLLDTQLSYESSMYIKRETNL